MSRKPLRATDRRKGKIRNPESDSETGSGQPLAALFNDRRKPNGQGKRAH